MTDDTRDRVISVERDVKHILDTIEKISTKLESIHDAFNQGKGFKVAAVAVIGFVGGLIPTFLTKFSGLFQALPK